MAFRELLMVIIDCAHTDTTINLTTRSSPFWCSGVGFSTFTSTAISLTDTTAEPPNVNQSQLMWRRGKSFHLRIPASVVPEFVNRAVVMVAVTAMVNLFLYWPTTVVQPISGGTACLLVTIETPAVAVNRVGFDIFLSFHQGYGRVLRSTVATLLLHGRSWKMLWMMPARQQHFHTNK